MSEASPLTGTRSAILSGKVSERVLLMHRELRRGEESTKRGQDITQQGKRRQVLSNQLYIGNLQQGRPERFTVQENFTGAVRLTWTAVIMWV